MGVTDWITSWMRVRGFLERSMEGVRMDRMVEERDFASVPDRPDNGRTITSNVARDACSTAKRTSTGPETEARTLVSPSKIDHVANF